MIKINDVMKYIGSRTQKSLKLLLAYITEKELSYLRDGYYKYHNNKVKDGIVRNGYIGELEKFDDDLKKNILKILNLETTLKNGSPGSPGSSGSEHSGGRKVLSVKKEICGKLRCIYKIPGSRKEHIKYKRRLITVTEYKKLMKAKS